MPYGHVEARCIQGSAAVYLTINDDSVVACTDTASKNMSSNHCNGLSIKKNIVVKPDHGDRVYLGPSN